MISSSSVCYAVSSSVCFKRSQRLVSEAFDCYFSVSFLGIYENRYRTGFEIGSTNTVIEVIHLDFSGFVCRDLFTEHTFYTFVVVAAGTQVFAYRTYRFTLIVHTTKSADAEPAGFVVTFYSDEHFFGTVFTNRPCPYSCVFFGVREFDDFSLLYTIRYDTETFFFECFQTYLFSFEAITFRNRCEFFFCKFFII